MSNIKKRVVHIHTHYEFVYSFQRFEGDYFENTIIIIENKVPYKGSFKDKAIIFSRTRNDFQAILDICKIADLVVLYAMDVIKSKIALSLPGNIKVAWRFFGYELYQKRKDIFLSNKSRYYSSQNNFLSFTKVKLSLYRLYFYFRHKGQSQDKMFFRAINRTNYMLVLFEEEYQLLRSLWVNLPEMIQLPRGPIKLRTKLPDFDKKETIKPIIVLGNRRSAFNNHIDLIEAIEAIPQKKNYDFQLIFNYGPNDNYAQTVRKLVKDKPHYTLIENFMTPEEFSGFYESISALVINGYRQIAAANIRVALLSGVKVYLNEKNVYLHWLRKSGFNVFNIEDFESDLKNNNIKLNYHTAFENLKIFKNLTKEYTENDFQQLLFDKLQ